MSLSPPPSKQSKQNCPISKLTDAELREIFKRLPPYERLLTTEVCRQWYEISRTSWTDVTAIDLSPIPGAHIRAIIKQCPNLHCVFGLDKSLEVQSFASIFSENLQHTEWNELVLHRSYGRKLLNALLYSLRNEKNGCPQPPEWRFGAELLPASLTRLQLSGLRYDLIPSGLSRLQNLECLILHSHVSYWCKTGQYQCINNRLTVENFRDILTLRNLRELYIGPAEPFRFVLDLKLLMSRLPQLEVLFLVSIYNNSIGQLADLITRQSSLRILVFTGRCKIWTPIEIPARKRYPNGFGADPLPLLHIFAEDHFMQTINFAPSDAARVFLINEPLPKFLEQKDIALIFKGVWIAAKIREGAISGAELWTER